MENIPSSFISTQTGKCKLNASEVQRSTLQNHFTILEHGTINGERKERWQVCQEVCSCDQAVMINLIVS